MAATFTYCDDTLKIESVNNGFIVTNGNGRYVFVSLEAALKFIKTSFTQD